MKKALIILVVASFVGIGLRYAFPKELIIPQKQAALIDDVLAETLKEETVVEQSEEKIEQATVSNTAVLDTLSAKQPIEEKSSQNVIPEIAVVSQEGTSLLPLQQFYKKLRDLENEKGGQLRIAYFGDSMIDADMIVMQFRHYLQQRFGGFGVGFVPITSPSASGRYSIKHSYSRNWSKQTFLRKNDTIFPFGIIGETFFVGNKDEVAKASVTYKRGPAYKELGLVNPILFYGQQRQYDSIVLEPAIVQIQTDDSEETLELSANSKLNKVALPNGQKRLKITVEDYGRLPFYGVSFASNSGIVVDNLSVRGNSGLPLTRLRTNLMRQFNKEFKYDVVILSYGTNVFSPTYKGFRWYSKRMRRVVKHMKNCFSGAEVIIVSMADRAMKEEEEMQTPEELPKFIRVQKSIADSTNSAFFNLYEAMGGEGSMVRWAEAEPSLANKDYTHFNSRGAKKAAGLFYNWLISGYDAYVANNPETSEPIETATQTETIANTAVDSSKQQRKIEAISTLELKQDSIKTITP